MMPGFRSRFQWLANSPTVKPPCFDQWLTLDLSNLCGQVFSPIADVAGSANYLSRGNGCQGSPNSPHAVPVVSGDRTIVPEGRSSSPTPDKIRLVQGKARMALRGRNLVQSTQNNCAKGA